MSKYVGFVIATGFVIYWFVQWLRRPKVGEAKTIPTGVSSLSYFTIAMTLFLAPLALFYGGQRVVKEIDRELNWQKTEGRVTDDLPAGLYKGRPQFIAQFTFEDQNKVSHLVVDSNAKPRPVQVGEAVSVLYDPESPDRALIDNFEGRWLFSGFMTLFGAAMLFYSGGGALQILKLQSLQKISKPSAQVGPIEGKFLRSKKNFFLSLKRKPSWRIIAEYRDLAGRVYVSESEPIWDYNPETWAKPDVPVPLYMDRVDTSRAWIRVQDYFLACK